MCDGSENRKKNGRREKKIGRVKTNRRGEDETGKSRTTEEEETKVIREYGGGLTKETDS